MTNLLVAGLINVETTMRIDGFPVEYHPQHFPFFGVHTAVSGVGYNVARALTTLGDQVTMLSMLGDDLQGQMIRSVLAHDGIDAAQIMVTLPESPQSVILYDSSGRRACFTDLKDIQERVYPVECFALLAAACDACVLCNINFVRGLLPIARRLGKLVATDIHTIADPDDSFNRDFMAAADILFCSDERLPVAPETWVRMIADRYDPAIQVVGLGDQGALLFERGDSQPRQVPALTTRPVVNTIGAGDSLFSAFLHAYLQSGNAYQALRLATLFASWKVGGNGGADGLLTSAQLAQLAAQHLVS
jgi:ribokinase